MSCPGDWTVTCGMMDALLMASQAQQYETEAARNQLRPENQELSDLMA